MVFNITRIYSLVFLISPSHSLPNFYALDINKLFCILFFFPSSSHITLSPSHLHIFWNRCTAQHIAPIALNERFDPVRKSLLTTGRYVLFVVKKQSKHTRKLHRMYRIKMDFFFFPDIFATIYVKCKHFS